MDVRRSKENKEVEWIHVFRESSEGLAANECWFYINKPVLVL